MVGKPKSETKKKQAIQEEAESLIQDAIQLYHEEQQRVDRKPMRLRKVCEKMEEDYRKATGCTIKLNHNTISNRVKGGISMDKFNRKKTLLTAKEENVIVGYALESADHGFPLSHR